MQMDKGWDLAKLRAHVEGLDDQKEDLLAFIASFGRYNQIYEYHLQNRQSYTIVVMDTHLM